MIKYFCDMCGREITKKPSVVINSCYNDKFQFCEECSKFINQKVSELGDYVKNPMFYKNKKNKNIYNFLGIIRDCTNKNDGTEMALYQKDNMMFVREYKEFLEKFEQIK